MRLSYYVVPCFMALVLIAPNFAHAKLKVITTTTTLADLTKKVGGEHISVESITRPGQDPHFLEAKPSYMVKLRDADLLIIVGLDLEIGWLRNVVRGARNPKLREGEAGYLNTGSLISAIDLPNGKVDRADGDVHPLGNPHFYLDPTQVEKIVPAIAAKLSQLDPSHSNEFSRNSTELVKAIREKHAAWTSRINSSGVKHVITYHRTLNYFLTQYGLAMVGTIEPKPGIPPTSKHIIELVQLIKNTPNVCILSESFFEDRPANRLGEETNTPVVIVPTEVKATKSAENYFDLMESLVNAVERCGVHKG